MVPAAVRVESVANPLRLPGAPTQDERFGGVGICRKVLEEQAGAELPQWHVLGDRSNASQLQSDLEKKIL